MKIKHLISGSKKKSININAIVLTFLPYFLRKNIIERAHVNRT